MKILAVEDDENSRILLCALLEHQGHTVESAPNGKIALKLAQGLVPDIIITDVLMPEMDGYSLCKQIKSDPKLAHAAVVFYTSTYTTEDDKRLGLALGASRYISKPQEPEIFERILLEVIQEYKTQKLPVPTKPQASSETLTTWHEQVLINKLQKKLSDLENEKKELFVSREKYRSIIESLKKDFIFFSYDTQGKLIYISPSVLNILGFSPEKLIDSNDLLPWMETSKKLTESYWTKNSLLVDQVQYEFDVTDKSGNIHHMSIKEVPIFDKEHNLIAIDGVAEDVTKKRRTETAIKKLYQGVQQSPISVIITDIDGNIEYANPQFEKMTGYPLDEIWGGNTRVFKSGEQPQEFYEDLWQTISAGKIWRGEFHNKKKSGEFFWKKSTIKPVFDKGKIINYIDFGEDISSAKAQEALLDKTRDQLATSEKLAGIGRLVAGVSHEVLNPLNIISLQVQMLQNKVNENPIVQKYCGKMNIEIERIIKIMGALLLFSRKGDSQRTQFSIKDIVAGVLDLVQQTFSLDNITIDTEYDATLKEITADKEKLRQVFLNLINNAKQAMPEGGTLSIKCQETNKGSKEFIRVSISDTGAGIKSENLSKLFEPFFTTKPEGEGTGMGLAVVHGIIEEHKGTITVESQEGKGATFIIDLPVAG